MQAPPPQGPQHGHYPAPKRQTNVAVWVILAVFGIGCLGLVGVFAAVGLPLILQARTTGQSTRCLSNTKELALAVTMYSADNDSTLPVAEKWLDGIERYVHVDRRTYCPTARAQSAGATGYAFNKDMSGKNLLKLEKLDQLPLIFDSTLQGRNATSGPETLPSPGRHRKDGKQGNNIAYVDAGARFVPTNP